MSRSDQTRKVTAIRGELLRFKVESWTPGEEDYLVDLLENEGAGECDCIHWRTRIWPMIRDRLRDWRSPDLECSHIRAAKRLLVIETIREGIRYEKRNQAR